MRLFITVKPMPGDTSAAVACQRSGFKAETRAESYRGPGHDGGALQQRAQALLQQQDAAPACRPGLSGGLPASPACPIRERPHHL